MLKNTENRSDKFFPSFSNLKGENSTDDYSIEPGVFIDLAENPDDLVTRELSSFSFRLPDLFDNMNRKRENDDMIFLEEFKVTFSLMKLQHSRIALSWENYYCICVTSSYLTRYSIVGLNVCSGARIAHSLRRCISASTIVDQSYRPYANCVKLLHASLSYGRFTDLVVRLSPPSS